MADVADIIGRMAAQLDLPVINMILNFVDEHHIHLGRQKWKEGMAKVHEEYAKVIHLIWWRGNTNAPWDERVQSVFLRVGRDCEDHDLSCRLFNHRGINTPNTPELREKWRLRGAHWPPITIANAMKAKTTLHLVPENYFYQILEK